MTDLLDRDLTNAALDLLRADTGLTVYPNGEGYVPATPATPYVRVFTHTEWPPDGDANAIDGLSVSTTTRWYCHCVGENEYAAAAVSMRVRTALLNARPTVTGRNCGLIYMEAAEPTNRTELGGSPLYDRPVVYAMVSFPG